MPASGLWIKHHKGTPFLYINNDDGDTLNTFVPYRPIESLTPDEFRTKNYYNRDYAAIIKLPGPGNSTVLIFMGIGYISLVETVQMFTQRESLAALECQLTKEDNKVPPYFEMLIEMSCFLRTGLGRKIKFFRKIAPDSVTNNLASE